MVVESLREIVQGELSWMNCLGRGRCIVLRALTRPDVGWLFSPNSGITRSEEQEENGRSKVHANN